MSWWKDETQSPIVVERAGGFEPKTGFLSSGKRVVAYRQLPSFDLVLAVER